MSERAPNQMNWAGFAVCEQTSLKQKKLMRTMLNTVVDYGLIAENDHIMVAISGGKDSYTMLDLLLAARVRAPYDFRITAVHLDQVQPGYDGEPLKNWLLAHEIDHLIVQEDTYSIVVDKTKPGGTFCSLCSRLRRGILYRVAEDIGANKIALGHHRDDSIETLLLNLIYAGKMQAMPAKYVTDDGKFEVIRPLIEVAENDISNFAAQKKYPILPCNLCGSQEGLKRERMKQLLDTLEQEKPDVRSVMLHALKNVNITHLLDKRYTDGNVVETPSRKKRLTLIRE